MIEKQTEMREKIGGMKKDMKTRFVIMASHAVSGDFLSVILPNLMDLLCWDNHRIKAFLTSG